MIAKPLAAAVGTLAVAAIYGWQLHLAASSKGAHLPIQSLSRDVARAWIESNAPQSEKLEARSPIGLTSLGCRFWALDFFRGNCYGLVIYAQSLPSAKAVSRLGDALTAPCEYVKSIRSDSATIRIDELVQLCRAIRPEQFRLVVSFQRVESRTDQFGFVTNSFEILKVLKINGRT